VRRVAAGDPAHRRIMAQTFGVVHILVPGEATKYRLSEQPGQCVPTILADACGRWTVYTLMFPRRLQLPLTCAS
jgi:hypothetical protein